MPPGAGKRKAVSGGGAKKKQQSREAPDVESMVAELAVAVGERRAVPFD